MTVLKSGRAAPCESCAPALVVPWAYKIGCNTARLHNSCIHSVASHSSCQITPLTQSYTMSCGILAHPHPKYRCVHTAGHPKPLQLETPPGEGGVGMPPPELSRKCYKLLQNQHLLLGAVQISIQLLHFRGPRLQALITRPHCGSALGLCWGTQAFLKSTQTFLLSVPLIS